MDTIVDQIDQLHLEGNIIPASWYKNLTFPKGKRNSEKGKPHLPAIVILSDIIYWYRKTEIRDEITGEVIERRKRFSSDKLQRSYSQLCNMFGFGKEQARQACDFLVEKGMIIREFKDITLSNGDRLRNVMYLEPIPDNIKLVTYHEERWAKKIKIDTCPPTTEHVSTLKPIRADEEVDNTYITTENTTEITTDFVIEKNQKESKNPDTEEEKKPETFEDFGFYSNPVESLVSMKEFDADGNQIAPETVYKDRLAKVVDKSLFAPHTKRDVSRFPEEVQALAQIFIDKTSILPTKSEMSHWIEHLRNMLQMGVTSDILGGAVDRAFRDNMCVKSPASVKYALTDLLKGGGRGAKTVYEAASQVFE